VVLRQREERRRRNGDVEPRLREELRRGGVPQSRGGTRQRRAGPRWCEELRRGGSGVEPQRR